MNRLLVVLLASIAGGPALAAQSGGGALFDGAQLAQSQSPAPAVSATQEPGWLKIQPDIHIEGGSFSPARIGAGLSVLKSIVSASGEVHVAPPPGAFGTGATATVSPVAGIFPKWPVFPTVSAKYFKGRTVRYNRSPHDGDKNEYTTKAILGGVQTNPRNDAFLYLQAGRGRITETFFQPRDEEFKRPPDLVTKRNGYVVNFGVSFNIRGWGGL